MQVTIINGGLKDDNRLEESLRQISSELVKRGFNIKIFELSKMAINNCAGCFSCLVKSPGICAINDDMGEILKAYVNSKSVILASTVTVGFVTSLLKVATDRLLPLFHAHLTIHEGVFCHRLRYKKNPSMLLLLNFLNDDDRVYLEDIINSYSRVNLMNYRKTIVCEDSTNNIKNEISDL